MALIDIVFLLWASVATAVLGQLVFNPVNDFQAISGESLSFPLDIHHLFNNRGFGKTPEDANFDGSGNAYPADYIPPPTFFYDGFNYRFPQYQDAGNDNMVALGQAIQVPHGKYFSVQMLAASESGMRTGIINSTYSDGSTSSGALLIPAWWSWPYPTGGDLVFPYYLDNSSINYNRSNIFQTISWLDSSKDLVSLTLPNVTQIHIFALTLTAASTINPTGPHLEAQFARSTQKWIDGTDKIQIIEVVINNIGSEFVLQKHSVGVSIDSPGLETVVKGKVKRLGPGDQAIVQIGVVNKEGVPAGSWGNSTVVISGEDVITNSYTFNSTFGIRPYEPTYESIYSHESPDWYNGAKYGIFIHWGVYAVPGWGNSGSKESYAEWYWWDLNQGPDYLTETYEYHLETYGPEVVYDDFIQNFTADAWDPKEWVDLFADAGAQYFVQVSKHHDGYAIFDLPANVTQRTSVAQFPHRNLLQELFDAAAQYQPRLHRATYYSLPEWFNPDYKKYGFSEWPGGNATNPFTNQTLPYTGYVPVSDYIEDVILPEMNTLADMGTEIMWCDIGGPNRSTEFAAAWYNRVSEEQNRQVVMNARCGLPGDFDTPEYARYPGVQVRKWESNLGMDPDSYGYNRATPAASYMNASEIVTSLVDIVSKNGNFLLDVGPQANGTILEVEQQNLRQAGTWIISHGEAIFNTTYWFVTPEEGSDIRFTTTPDAFYISTLSRPNSTLTITSPIPWVDGDMITVVGGNRSGQIVPSHKLDSGSIQLEISQDIADADEFAWVFKITY